jgi:glutamine synthetase
VEAGRSTTVLTCVVDMQGRLMGKRFQAAHFLESAHRETHGCDYLLAVDVEMTPVPGLPQRVWEKGYGDYVPQADLGTLRRAAPGAGTAMVMLRPSDLHGELVSVAPRRCSGRQVERARAMGFEP